jgi:MFS family permease
LKEIRETLSEKSVLGLMILQMVIAFRTGAQDFLPSYFVQSLGMTTLHAGLIFTVFLGCGIPAPFLWGYLSDKLERKRIVIFVMGAAAVLWYLLPFAKGDLQLLLTLVSIGFVSQSVGGVVQAWVAESTKRENRDLVYGVFFTISFSLGSLSPAILGYVTDLFGFQANFTWVAVVSLLAVVVAANLIK